MIQYVPYSIIIWFDIRFFSDLIIAQKAHDKIILSLSCVCGNNSYSICELD